MTPQLYVMLRADTRWHLAAADLDTGALAVLLEDIGGFSAGPATFVVVLDKNTRLVLWDGQRARRLHTCAASCHDPVLAPAGDFVAWLEETAQGREVWLMALRGGTAQRLGAAEGRPVWHPRGESLAFVAPEGLAIWDVRTQQLERVALSVMAQPSWSPEGQRLAIVATPGMPLVYDVLLGLPQPMMQTETLALTTELAWSPTGAQIAVLQRRFSPPAEAHADEEAHGVHEEGSRADALGAQPWVWTQATGEFMALPADSGAGFARPVWSADGRRLAAVRLPMGVPDPQPEVWVWDVETGRLLQRLAGAAAPAWSNP